MAQKATSFCCTAYMLCSLFSLSLAYECYVQENDRFSCLVEDDIILRFEKIYDSEDQCIFTLDFNNRANFTVTDASFSSSAFIDENDRQFQVRIRRSIEAASHVLRISVIINNARLSDTGIIRVVTDAMRAHKLTM